MRLLEIDELASGYKSIPIIHDVSFHLEDGEFLGILGHNGMGKTTLLKCISGELPATRGDIRHADANITRLPAHARARRGIGFVPQGRRIFPALTVRENLAIGALAAGKPKAIVETVLATFPRLTPILDRRGGVLSGGEQQILALARCLCGEPQLILLDEPTEGIQPSIRDEIVEILQRLRRTRRLTILLVEQNVEFLSSLCDRMYRMEKGTLVSGGQPPET